MLCQKSVIGLGDDIDNGIADGDNIERGIADGNTPWELTLGESRGTSRASRLAQPAIDASVRESHESLTMFRALSLSIGQLGDPAFLKVLAKSLALTLAIFVVLGIGLYWLLQWGMGWLGLNEASGGALAALAAIAIVLLSGWLLFRVIAIAVIGLFTEEIVDAVERRHYPEKAALARKSSHAEQVRVALGSVGRTIGWNLLASPVYIVLLFTGIGTAIAFFAVNALLLSRDLGDLVAVRHVAREQRRDWLRVTRARRLQTGLVSAGLFMVPVVNLLAPILSAAMAAHMLHVREDLGGETKNA